MTVKPSGQNQSLNPSSSEKPLSKQENSDCLSIGDTVYNLADHTPMMVQYLTMKANYPQALLLYRMGDFYELFFDDAKRAAQILDITLTRRGTDKAGNTIAMAGVPFHAADSYMARLIATGQTVVVCEQVDDASTDAASPSSAPSAMGDKQKKSSKATGIMRREVVKTLTAGTITDDALIAPNHTPTVVAIDIAQPRANSKQPLQAAVSQLDLAAGTLTTQSLSANHDDYDDLQTQMLTVLARFAPSECIISEALSDATGSADTDWPLWLRQHLDCPIIEVAANDFHRAHAADTLCQQFGVQRLDGLGIHDAPLSQSSCAALIHYAQQTQQRHVPQVNQLIVEFSDDYLIIDAGSQQNLELFAPVSSSGTSLVSVVGHCQTPMGRRLLVQQMKRPLRQHARINMRLDAIDKLLQADNPADSSKHSSPQLQRPSLVSYIRDTLSAIGDIERITSRIGLMSAKPRDLRKLVDGINSSAQLSTLLEQAGIHHEQAGLLAMLMQQLPAQLPAVQSVAELIERAIIPEPPAHVRDGGMLAAGYDAEFDRLTHLHDNIQLTLDEMVARARQDNQLPSLKVGFNKVSGFYFELPKMQAKNAPAHFIRRQTLKSSERFITDELKEVETEYLSAQSLALAREKQLYHELLTILSNHLAALQQLSAAIAQIDVLSNWAQLATLYNWQRPVMTNDSNDGNLLKNSSQTRIDQSSIDIQQGRHVVVEAALTTDNTSSPAAQGATQTFSQNLSQHPSKPARAHAFVANDCALGSANTKEGHPERLLMITGPNMGGKSTYMRQTALIVLLAHCGSFVPAASARIGDIDRIFTRIGSADDLAGGKSTFMVEMIETANILNQATDKSLVLMDEVGRGTATTDGLAIAHACVNRLLEIGCLTLFATHYFELTQLAAQNKGIRNVHVAASEIDGQLLLLHQIRDGAASSSFGLHVAKMAGIPPSVIGDAKRYLRDHPTMAANTQSVDDAQAVDDKSDLAKSRTDNCQLDDQRPLTTIETSPLSHEQAVADIPQQNQLFSLQDELAAINPDNLTPKQAHDLLYHLKDIISH
ncbi:MAG: DNA mismatch repair protein MutS [Psychrobacter sp.]|uniref:DNA mismatch repair protein MutS n=1 Tax=Psychrobacter sp. TaxID=56811 RepID=UPI002649AA8C|nr:DNA mismatch repair protein MutS [Psychrobacter sp.]MDN5619928.1 DNA mismatch repair protein MutS [Psychrobacter sp.]